jgi:glutathione peroxidase-family protein
VNVASKCGYTASGYALLSKIAEMKDQGVEVAIFPCNQFGAQEVNDLLLDYILISYA